MTVDRHRPAVDWSPRQTQRCACGGLVTADPSDSRQVRAAVELHRATLRHQAWLTRQGKED